MSLMNDKNKSDQQLSLEERIVHLERRLTELEKSISVDSMKPRESDSAKRKRMSLKEFVNQKAPQNTRETTLAVAHYLENDGVVPFNVRDLERGFRAGKIPPPKNINDMVNKNIKRGLLMEAAERKNGLKAWELTATGEQEIERGFGKKC